MWGDCLYGLALASDVPYGQSSIWVTANKLLALVMPGNWVDRLGNDRQEVRGGGQRFNGMKHHVPPSPLCYKFFCHSHTVHIVQMRVECLCLWIIYSWTDGESEIKESCPWLQSISCGIKAYLRISFYVGYLLNVKKSGTGLVILFRNTKVLLSWL